MVLSPTYEIGSRAAFDVRGDILVDQCASLQHDVFAKMAELMHQTSAAYYGAVVDHHLSCQLCGIGDNHIIAYHTVVSYMCVSHDEAIVADFGEPA